MSSRVSRSLPKILLPQLRSLGSILQLKAEANQKTSRMPVRCSRLQDRVCLVDEVKRWLSESLGEEIPKRQSRACEMYNASSCFSLVLSSFLILVHIRSQPFLPLAVWMVTRKEVFVVAHSLWTIDPSRLARELQPKGSIVQLT